VSGRDDRKPEALKRSSGTPARLRLPAWRVLVPVGLGTALSLMGDAALYTVLPTHTTEAGVALASVGLLLSANRWVRLLTNTWAGLAYDRWPRRWLFVPALGLGALSTLLYAVAHGFWPLLAARLLWGLAWSGIWVGGNLISLDAAAPEDRGRLIGLYQLCFYLGTTLAAPLGGLLTDGLGYHRALAVAAALTGLGAFGALVFLPETRRPPRDPARVTFGPGTAAAAAEARRPGHVWLPALLYSVNRFVLAGVLVSTLALLVQARVGPVRVGGLSLGLATLSGVLLGLSTLFSMAAAPLAGGWSDRVGDRWRVAAAGLVPGIVGMGLLASGQPGLILPAVLLTAMAGGSNQSLATAALGDEADAPRRGRALSAMHTAGDLGSALAPPLAYALLPVVGLSGVYTLCALLLAGMLALALWRTRARRPVEDGLDAPP